MSRSRSVTLPSLVESYFHLHLVKKRGLSVLTIYSYRDTLRLLFVFLAKRRHTSVSALTLDDINVDAILAFLEYLQADRSNKESTRNVRLAAIHSFADYLVEKDPTRAEQYAQVLSLPGKKSPPVPAEYLEPQDVKLLIEQPDRSTVDGRRDYALMLFLYNTGARISEALNLCVDDLSLTRPRHVKLLGKGSKQRLCPLWPETARALAQLPAVQEGQPRARIFCNHTGGPLSRDGAAYLLRKYKTMAARTAPALRKRRISPHVLRHSCASTLVQAGVDLTVIRDYLGHASISTTNRYVSTNVKMKRDALEQFWRHSGLSPARGRWAPKPDVISILESI